MNRHLQRLRPWIIATLATAACNSAPTTPDVIITPEVPGTLDALVANANALDDDGDKVTYGYQWFLDGEIQADLTSEQVPAERTTKGDQWTVEVTPNDGTTDGPVGSASVGIANTPAEGVVSINPDPATTTDELTASGSAEDVDGDEVSWTWTWLRDGETTGLTDAVLLSTHTTRGETWEVIGIAFDGETSSEPARRSITIGNGQPVIESIRILPTPASRASDLQAEVVATDPDDDPITYLYRWTINGVDAIGTNGSQLPVALFAQGDVIEVEATPNDGMTAGATVSSDPVTIENALPSIVAVDLQPSPIRERSTVRCTPTGWNDGDGDTESYGWAWAVNGSPIGNTTATLTGESFDRGDTVQCTATPTDGTGTGAAVSSAVITVDNTPPVLDSAELSDPTPSTEGTLTVNLGEFRDDDDDLVSLSYEWFINGVSTSTEPSLPPGSLVAGDVVRCEVTPTDGTDPGVAAVTSEVEVGNTEPLVLSVDYLPETPGTTTSLTAVPTGFDADGDDLDYTFRWRVNGTSIIDVTTDTLPADRFSRDDTISLTVTANDGSADSPPFAANDVVVGNTAPTVASATLDPDPITESTGVQCLAEGWDDADDDAAAYLYEWTAGGIVVGDDSDTLTGDWYAKGDVILCTVTPTDGMDEGTPVPSTPAVVQNDLPVIAGAFIDNDTPAEGDVLAVNVVGLADADPADQASLVVFYEWFVNDVSVATTPTLDSTAFGSGDLVHAVVRAYDGEEFGADVVTPAVLVGNSAPTVLFVELSPEDPDTTTPITATVNAVDPDGDDLTATFQWFVNDVEVFGETSDTLDPSFFERDDEVTATAVASDDEFDSAPVTSAPITIVNTPPGAPVVRISPRWAMAEVDDLVCEIIEPAPDADADNITYTFRWFVDDQPYASPTTTRLPGDTVPASAVLDGTSWRCEAAGVDSASVGAPGEAMSDALVFDLRSAAGGSDYTCALDANSEIRCWGLAGPHAGMGGYPAGPHTQIAAGFSNACAIADDDSLSCWGDATPLLVPPPGSFRRVSVGADHACAIGSNGIAQCWGNNANGQGDAPVAILTEIAAGLTHTCAIDENAAIRCWGADNFGQLDAPDGVFDVIISLGFSSCALDRQGAVHCWGGPMAPVPPGEFVALSGSALHACAIDRAGEAICWGDPSSQSLVPEPGPFAQLAAGYAHTCGSRTDGSMACWGNDTWGQLQPPTLSLVDVAAGYHHTCGVDTNGVPVCWGQDDAGQSSPPPLPNQALLIATGSRHSCVIAGLSRVTCWGDDSMGQLQATTEQVIDITAGRNHTCAKTIANDIVCWGDNTWFQSTPPANLGPWNDLSAGEQHTCGIDAFSELQCWGNDRSDVLQAPTGTYTAVASGGQHACAVATDGTIACWGNDSLNQATAPPGDEFVAVVTGTTHSCALDDDGAVICWGAPQESRLQVPPGTYTHIRANADHTCGLREDGSTVCWGRYLH